MENSRYYERCLQERKKKMIFESITLENHNHEFPYVRLTNC